MHHYKKLIASLLVLCLVFASLPFSATADSLGDFEYSVTDNATVTITKYTGSDATVNIPAQINEMDVTVIGEKAFSNNTSLRSVVFPDTLKAIDKSAFEACISLQSISFPDSLESVGDSAFFNCISLSQINSTPYLYNIGYQAFHNTAWFINAPGGFLYVGRVLYSYKGLVGKNTVITVPDYTAAIAPNAFDGQYNLYEVYLPVGIRSIGKYAFKNCYSLNTVRIPPTVTYIGSYAFLNADAALIKGVNGSTADSCATEQNLTFSYDKTLDYLDGDMDKDGTISSADIRLLMKAVVLSQESDHERYLSSDIVYDGKIATSDIREWMLLTIA